MTRVWYFSAAGHSRAVARYLAAALDAPLHEIGENAAPADTAVVVFPVYCQNIPAPVKAFLPSLSAKNLALIATYGKMGCGNVLWEASQMVTGNVIAGAYVPTGHTYLEQGSEADYSTLLPVVDKLRKPHPVTIPRLKKWWLADVAPGLRSRMSVSLRKTKACNACGLCSRICSMGTMKNGKPGKNCIRCLRCVAECPQKAMSFSCSPVLGSYLRKPRQIEWIIYV